MDNLSTFLKAIFPCLPLSTPERGIQLSTETTATGHFISEKAFPYSDDKEEPSLTIDEAASSIVSLMLNADFKPDNNNNNNNKPNPSLPTTTTIQIHSIVHAAGGWSEWLAARILAVLETVLKAGKPLTGPMRTAYEKACEAFEATEGFAVDHPVFCTVVALGVLVELTPYVVGWLGFCAGFGELGPIEGSWAALWQSRYAGMVPKRSLFAYFQRLGMTWKRV